MSGVRLFSKNNDMQKVLILVGPTASGKTSLSIELSKRLKSEIISADSRQVYKYLSIGTAKPTELELNQAIHHFVDIYEPSEPFNAGQFSREARTVIDQLLEGNKTPIVVGGSGLYIKALVDGFSSEIESDDRIRISLKHRLEQEGIDSLYSQLEKVDPETAKVVHKNNVQRVMRALEIYLITGKPFSEIKKRETDPVKFTPVFVGLNWEREELYSRINKRVDIMIDEGLIPEVAIIKRRGLSENLNSLQTVGYKEVFSYFNGQIEFEDMISEIKKNTRRYAKRQMTWFKNDSRVKWFDMDDSRNTSELADSILDYFKRYTDDEK